MDQPDTPEYWRKKFASEGGKAVFLKRGKQWMKKIGKRGALARWPKKDNPSSPDSP